MTSVRLRLSLAGRPPVNPERGIREGFFGQGLQNRQDECEKRIILLILMILC